MTAPTIWVAPNHRRIQAITRVSDTDFAPAHLEQLETPKSPLRRATVGMVVMMAASVAAWSAFAGLDTFAVASGRVQSGGRSRVVQPLETGKVERILVTNGSKVAEGQALIMLDRTQAEGDRASASAQMEALEAELARRHAEIEAITHGKPCCPLIAFPASVGSGVRSQEEKVLAADLAQIEAAHVSLRMQVSQKYATEQRLLASVEARSRLIGVLQRRLDMKLALIKMGAGTRTDVLDARQKLQQEETNRAYDQGQIAETDAAAVALQQKAVAADKQFIDDQAGKLEDARRRRNRIEQELEQARARLDHATLRSPVDGTVEQLAVTTIGQVVRPGQSLVVVVPLEGDLDIEALVLNKDIGDLAVGQDAVVKLDPFPFTRYGALDGKVVWISHDAVDGTDYVAPDPDSADAHKRIDRTPGEQNLVFLVTIRLKADNIMIDRRPVPLSPGMTTSVEILTGRRSVMSYILRPVREAFLQAGHER